MNLNAYIESGILELFVLDLLDETDRADVLSLLVLFPALQEEVERIESTLETFAHSIAIDPSAALKRRIQTSLADAIKEQEMDIDHLVLINEHSDYRNWLRLVAEHFPVAFEKDNYFKVLRSENGVTQVLIVSTADIEEGAHDELRESFLILKGECRCTFGEDSFYLGPGGYTQVPLHQYHKVEMTSGPVMAIMQRVS